MRMEMIAMTTNSSIRVNPDLDDSRFIWSLLPTKKKDEIWTAIQNNENTALQLRRIRVPIRAKRTCTTDPHETNKIFRNKMVIARRGVKALSPDSFHLRVQAAIHLNLVPTTC